jgi:phage regulator Rha-like protein
MNAITAISQAVLTMTSLEISELVESRHDSVKRSMETLRDKEIISFTQSVGTSHNGAGARPVEVYMVSKRDSYIVVAQLCPEFTARLVDRWQELEDRAKVALPDFSDPVAAARAWADAVEKTQTIAIERDAAIATKHLIGSKREATAMNKASQAVKKAKALEVELDRSKEYATVKRMEMLCHGQKFNWRLLKSASIEMGIQSIDVFDVNYGTVKAYHANVWREAYAVDMAELLGGDQ